MQTLVLHVVVWGASTEKFLNILLPSLIHGENLENIELEISTSPEDEKIISENINLNKIFKSVKFFYLDNIYKSKHEKWKYAVCTTAEQHFVERSGGKVMLFLPPDVCVAKGSLEYAIKCHTELGYNAVVTTAIKCVGEPPLGASPKELTLWCYQNLNVFTEHQIWGAVPCFNHASVLLYPCNAGYVIHAHHLMPVLIKHSGQEFKFNGMPDDDLITNIPIQEIKIIDNSDYASFIEISEHGENMLEVQNKPLTLEQIIEFGVRPRIKDHHRSFFKHRIIHRLTEGSTEAEDEYN